MHGDSESRLSVPLVRPTTLAMVLVGNRLLLLLIGWLALTFGIQFLVPGTWRALPNNPWFDGWLRWDAGWYYELATQGYASTVAAGEQSNTAFFPLLPLLTRAVAVVVGNVALSGLIVSYVSSGVALLLLYRMVAQRFGLAVAERTLLLLCFYPYSLYLSSFHTEPLFLCWVVCSFFYAERRSFGKAALFAACASATRNVGVLVTLGLATAYLESLRFDLRKIGWESLFLLLCPLGLGLHMLFLWMHTGSPLQFVYSQAAPGWAGGALLAGETAPSTLQLVWRFFGHPETVLFVVPSVWLLWRSRRKLPLSYLVWSGVTLLISMSSPGSLGRFLTVLFPVFIGAALLPWSRRQLVLLLACFAILLSIGTARQVLGMWVAG